VFVCGNVYDFYNRENHIGYPINDLCVEAWGVFETHYGTTTEIVYTKQQQFYFSKSLGVARYGFKTDKAYYSLNHPHLCYEAVREQKLLLQIDSVMQCNIFHLTIFQVMQTFVQTLHQNYEILYLH